MTSNNEPQALFEVVTSTDPTTGIAKNDVACAIPFDEMNKWTVDEMKKRFVVGDVQKTSTGFIEIYSVTTPYSGVGSDGTATRVEDAPIVHTGPVYLPFETTGTNKKGEPMNPYTVSFREDSNDAAHVFRTFAQNVDLFVRDWVFRTNPNNSNGGKYFKKAPMEMSAETANEMLDDKVRTMFYQNDKINEHTGQLYDPIASARIWRNNADQTFVGEDQRTPVDASVGHAKGNTNVLTLKFDGIICGETTINPRWTITNGFVVKRAGTFVVPAVSNNAYAQFATAGPKTNDDAPMADTFGGVPPNDIDIGSI